MKAQLDQLHLRIRRAAQLCGRDPESVRLVAVTKTVPAERVRQAVAAGVRILGENYIQEARPKIESLAPLPAAWHFIGHLQTNKAKYAVRLFDLIHTVDSLKLARELNREAGKIEKIQEILLQVNIAQETTKSGVSATGALELFDAIQPLAHLRVKGLMTMPPYFDAPERVRPFFRELRKLLERVNTRLEPANALGQLSMGMSGDFEAAIQEGATLIRVGTAIFGARD